LIPKNCQWRFAWQSKIRARSVQFACCCTRRPPNRRSGAGWPLIACVCQPMRRRGFEAESRGPARQVRATVASNADGKHFANPFCPATMVLAVCVDVVTQRDLVTDMPQRVPEPHGARPAAPTPRHRSAGIRHGLERAEYVYASRRTSSSRTIASVSCLQ